VEEEEEEEGSRMGELAPTLGSYLLALRVNN
jgi:hypothetical protein